MDIYFFWCVCICDAVDAAVALLAHTYSASLLIPKFNVLYTLCTHIFARVFFIFIFISMRSVWNDAVDVFCTRNEHWPCVHADVVVKDHANKKRTRVRRWWWWLNVWNGQWMYHHHTNTQRENNNATSEFTSDSIFSSRSRCFILLPLFYKAALAFCTHEFRTTIWFRIVRGPQIKVQNKTKNERKKYKFVVWNNTLLGSVSTNRDRRIHFA